MISILQRLINWLKYTGLWIPIPLSVSLIYLIAYSQPRFQFEAIHIGGLVLFSFVPSVYIWSVNRLAKLNGKSRFDWISYGIQTDPLYQPNNRLNVMRKRPPSEMLSDKPKGIVFGKYNSKYVCVLPNKKGATHTLITGTTGSGKSSSILADTIICANTDKKTPHSLVYIDIKGELTQKFFAHNAENLFVFNVRKRDLCGFDFLYDVSRDASDEELLTAFRRIVYNLIPLRNDEHDKFWVLGARNILLGVFLFAFKYKNCTTLPDMVDFALSKPLKELINDILAEVDSYSVVSKFLTPYGGEESAEETISSLSMNIGNALSLFATDETVRYLLRDNTNKISPTILEEGKHIAIQIEDAFLEQYRPVLCICLSTIFDFCLKRGEVGSDAKQIVFIIDEAGRLMNDGPIEGLQSLLQVGRSKGCCALLCMQSVGGLEGAYSAAQTKDILSNLPYRLILQAAPDDTNTVDMASKAFGKYTEKKKSISQGKNKSVSFSFEDKDILKADDLLQLPQHNQVVLISPSGAFLLKKVQYFKDKIISKKLKQIKKK